VAQKLFKILPRGSHQIPLPQLESAISLSKAESKSTFGFPKPITDAKIVTHYAAAICVGKAEALLLQHGFGNTKA
jgi:hypothetical protein